MMKPRLVLACLTTTDVVARARAEFDAVIATAVAEIWQRRTDRYSQLRSSSTLAARASEGRRVEMSYIGG